MAEEVVMTAVPKVENLEVMRSGKLTIGVSGVPGGGTNTVTHNFGFTPIVIAMVVDANDPGDNPRFLPDTIFNSSGAMVAQTKVGTTNATEVMFQVETLSGLGVGYIGDWEIRYYLLRHRSN